MFERLPLRDIHLPEPVSWWPPALGWWLLAVAAVLLAVLLWRLTVWARRKLARRRLRRQALEELERIQRDFEAAGSAARPMEELSILLRRVALTVSPEPGVAGHTGSEWVNWLRRTGPDDLDGNALQALLEAPYHPAPEAPPRPVFQAARCWIRHATSLPS